MTAAGGSWPVAAHRRRRTGKASQRKVSVVPQQGTLKVFERPTGWWVARWTVRYWNYEAGPFDSEAAATAWLATDPVK